MPPFDLLEPELEIFIPATCEQGHDIRVVARLPEHGLLPPYAPGGQVIQEVVAIEAPSGQVLVGDV